MRIRRNIASVPVRSAKETWRAIVDLVTGDGSIDRQQLDAAASIMESLIADELPASVPIVFKGAGPRVLIYCLYNEDAMEAGTDIDSLNANPTAGDWRVTAPAEDDDVAWMNKLAQGQSAAHQRFMPRTSARPTTRPTTRSRPARRSRSTGEP